MKSTIQENMLESKYKKIKKIAIGEPYAKNMHHLKQVKRQGHCSQKSTQISTSTSNSNLPRQTVGFPSSTDLYGGSVHSGRESSKYFGKSKFSQYSQQNTKKLNSVLSSIKEGAATASSGGGKFQKQDSFDQLSSESKENAALKHPSI